MLTIGLNEGGTVDAEAGAGEADALAFAFFAPLFSS